MQKIIIKVGTSTLTQGTQRLSRRHMLGLVQQMALLKSRGAQLVLVSSGAVATGRELLNDCQLEQPSKQTFASIGQVKLMQVWSELFSLFDLQVGQVLLTKEDFSKERASTTQDMIEGLIHHQIIPIVNENDAVSTKEYRIGNNDHLAGLVATLIRADALILLTDQEGLYTADPRLNPNAKLIPFVTEINEEIYALAHDSSTRLGTGGMRTKIDAARMACESGIRTIIASSSRPNILTDLADRKQLGTLFQEKSL